MTSKEQLFPVLYGISSSGKQYQWTIKVVQDEKSNVSIVTKYGTLDGKKTTHSRNIPRGKGKKDKFEQGVSEATSKWKAKQDKEGYSETKKKDTVKSVKYSAIRPMLAHTYELGSYQKTRGAKISYPALVQPKFDGLRCLAYLDGKGNVVLESRTGKSFYHLDHIRNELKTFFSMIKIVSPDSKFYFDGELYSHVLPFEKITGICRRETLTLEEELKESVLIRYYVYDCFDLSHLDQTNEQRFDILKKLFSDISTKYIVLSPTEKVGSEKEMLKWHKKYIEDGYEGIMIRNLAGLYKIKGRSKDLQKYKTFVDEEFKVIGYHSEEGAAGGVVWECITKDGKEFSVRPRGTVEERQQFLENADDYIGKKLTVIFQEYSEDGVPRFPVGKAFRDE
jgi:ATP-dependent DNA ligase